MGARQADSRLVARIVQSEHVRDASLLHALAKQEYLRLRDTCLPQLPEFDARNPVDGSAAVELCLSVRTGSQAQHVDRGLFNLVTGESDAIKGLHLPRGGLVTDQGGATVLVPGMTCALLLSDGDMLMPPLHSADIPPGQQLTVIAVKLRVDLPVHALCWTSLQQALAACFLQGSEAQLAPCMAQGPNPQLTGGGIVQMHAHGLKQAPEVQAPADNLQSPPVSPQTCSTSSPSGDSSDSWHLTIMLVTGRACPLNRLNGMSSIQELYVAAAELDCTPINQLKLLHKGHHLDCRSDAHDTLQHAGVSNGDMIQMLDRRCSQFKWQLFVTELNGMMLVVDTEPTATVSELKAALRAKTGIPIELMRVVFAGSQLSDDHRTLLACGLKAGCIVHIFVRMKGD